MDAVAFCVGLLLSATFLKSFSLGQIVINFEAEGDYLTKSGIRKYSLYSNPTNGQDTTTISCSSPISVPARLSIMKGDQTLAESTTFGDHPAEIKVTKIYENYKTTRNGIKGISANGRTKGTLAGVYVCRLMLMLPIQNQSEPFFVTMESEMVINTTRQSYICSSSVGQSGYVGEMISLYCSGKYYNFRNRGIKDYSIDWLDSSNHHNVLLSYPYPQFSCGYNNSVPVCQSPEIEVYPFFNITITPVNDLTDLSVTDYICSSRPPRLMHWAVIGKDGNILDPGNMYRYVKGGTRVTIFQSAGRTSLRISETVRGRNGIHTIICSTYDTIRPVVTSVSLEPISKNEIDCPENADSTTEQTTTTTGAYISTKSLLTEKDTSGTSSTGGTTKEDFTTRQTIYKTNSHRSTFSLHTRNDKSSTLPARDSTTVKEDLTTKQTTIQNITKTTAHRSTLSLHKNEDISSTLPVKRIISVGQTEVDKEYREDPVAKRPFKKDELAQGEDPGFSIGNIPVAFIALALLLAVGYIIFKQRRAPSKTEQTRDDVNDNIDSDIELHENPSFLSFSEAFGYTEKRREADKVANESQNKYDSIPTETELQDNPAYQSYSDVLEETSTDVEYNPSLKDEENCV